MFRLLSRSCSVVLPPLGAPRCPRSPSCPVHLLRIHPSFGCGPTAGCVFPVPTEMRLKLLLSCRSGGWGTAFSWRGGGGRASELPALSRARAVSILHPRTIALTPKAQSPRDSAAPANASGSVPVRPDSSCSPPPPFILSGGSGCQVRSGGCGAPCPPPTPWHVGPLGTAVPMQGAWGRRQPGTRWSSGTQSILSWGCRPCTRWGGCDSSIRSSPDLLTKAELFLKSSHSAKFASAARPAAAARRRG